MALTLDEVHNIKFRMAKRTGYEVLDVDEFVDQVEASFEQLQDENANLKRRLETLQPAAAGEQSDAETAAGENEASTGKNEAAAGRSQTVSKQSAEIMTVTTSSEASAAVTRLVQMSTEHAENVVAEAETEAARIRAEADDSAKQVTHDATTRAERVESEARANADQLRSQAQQNADELDRETDNRRTELFSQLEQERDQLADSVGELRTFESEFRQQLTDQLHGYLNAVSVDVAEPSAAPQALEMARAGSANREPDLGRTAAAGEPATTGAPGTDSDNRDLDVGPSGNGSDPNGPASAAATGGAAAPQGNGAGAGSDPTTAQAVAEPDGAGDPGSKTPRLDALLREDS